METARGLASPFVLLERLKVPPDGERSEDQAYDTLRQLWVSLTTGEPVVLQKATRGSEFGETVVTATREGLDQSEISGLSASEFGETTLTKTVEGHDQSEVSELASEFGETIMTRSREGHDQTELSGDWLLEP